ncbi:sugar ABC transporter permease [Leifsonia sp. Root227]|uniref:carbohydrate ABC transporter permease n=1 Tax=Leifsonia sp. Root227 TaxID=1736496 RepID=UPI0006FBDAB1|nr:sugar ABC transporter permease [Leifsonia sp. Root227]KRC47084.1 sugar ABC transporter permease [Leifsonia sp. Root227]
MTQLELTRAVEEISSPARAPRRRTPALRSRLPIWSMMALGMIGLIVFFVYPLIANLYYSFTSFDLVSSPTWIGLRNYIYLFTQDSRVGTAALNTLWFVVFLVPVRIICSLGIAMLLTRRKRASGFWRTLFYVPALVPPVASVVAFVFLFNPGTGPINTILRFFGIQGPLWFNDPALSKPSLLLLGVWMMGDIMVIFLAALLDVPRDQYEASSLDGANGRQRFWFITLPNISPVILFSAVTGVIAALQYFTEAAVASSVANGKTGIDAGPDQLLGYPNDSLLTYTQWMYVQGFTSFQLGYAAAMAVILFVVAAVVMAVLLRRAGLFKQKER